MAPITDLFANWPLSLLASIVLAGQLLLVLAGWIIVDIISLNRLRQSLRTAQLEIAQLWKKDPLDNLKTLRDLTQADRFGLLSRPIHAAILVDQANQPAGLADLTHAIEPRPIIERCPGRFWMLPIWSISIVLAVCGEIIVLINQVGQPIATSVVPILLYTMSSLLLLVGFKLADALALHQADTEIVRFREMLQHHFPVYTELALQHQQLLLQKQMAFHLKKMGPELSTSLGDTLQKHLVPAVRNMNQSIEQAIKHLNDEQQHGMGKLAGHFARQLDQMLGEHLTGLTASIESLNTLHESGVARTQSLLAQVERTTELQQQAGVISQHVLTSLTESRQELATSTEQLNQALSMGTSQISQTFADSSAQISQVYVDSTTRMNELYTSSANQFTQTLTASGDQLKSIYETSASQLSQAMINGSEQLTDSLASGSELMTASLTTASEQLTSSLAASNEQITTAMTSASEQLTTAMTTGSEQLQTIFAEGTKQLQLSHATGVETINAAMSGTSERILANLTAGGEQYTQILSGFVGEFSQKLTDSTATLNQTLADGAALLTQTFDAGHSDLHQTYIRSATELNQSFAQGSSQLSETFRTSQDLLDQSRSASAEQLNLILERTGDMTTEISSLLMTNQEESSRIKQEQLAVEEQIGSYFDQMHQQIIRVQDDLQSNLIDIFARFTDLTQTTLTQSDEQYQQMMTRLTDHSTELMNTLDEQVRELSFLVRDVSGEISGLNKTMDSAVSQFGEQLQSSTLTTFQAFDQGLSSIVGQLEETIRQISDAVDDLPAAVVSVRDFVEEETRRADRSGADGQ